MQRAGPSHECLCFPATVACTACRRCAGGRLLRALPGPGLRHCSRRGCAASQSAPQYFSLQAWRCHRIWACFWLLAGMSMVVHRVVACQPRCLGSLLAPGWQATCWRAVRRWSPHCPPVQATWCHRASRPRHWRCSAASWSRCGSSRPAAAAQQPVRFAALLACARSELRNKRKELSRHAPPRPCHHAHTRVCLISCVVLWSECTGYLIRSRSCLAVLCCQHGRCLRCAGAG